MHTHTRRANPNQVSHFPRGVFPEAGSVSFISHKLRACARNSVFLLLSCCAPYSIRFTSNPKQVSHFPRGVFPEAGSVSFISHKRSLCTQQCFPVAFLLCTIASVSHQIKIRYLISQEACTRKQQVFLCLCTQQCFPVALIPQAVLVCFPGAQAVHRSTPHAVKIGERAYVRVGVEGSPTPPSPPHAARAGGFLSHHSHRPHSSVCLVESKFETRRNRNTKKWRPRPKKLHLFSL